jgi:hypothetical protein
MLASFAFARRSWATSVFRHMPVIPSLGIFFFRLLHSYYFVVSGF